MTAPKVGDCVRAHGGRKVCRVSEYRAYVRGRPYSGRTYRACDHGHNMSGPRFNADATHRNDGSRYAACGICWPDGITEGES